MERQQVETLNPHSVEISRGSNGNVSLAVKVYAETPEQAAEQAQTVFASLEAQYPYRGK